MNALVTPEALAGLAIDDVLIAECLTWMCGYTVAGVEADDGAFQRDLDLIPEVAALQALLSYQQNNARQRYRHHDPGE